MKILIKLGGALLDEPAYRAGIAKQLALVAQQCYLVVVHGGGKQVTRFLEERGIKSEFVNGLRVSDEKVIDAVTKVIAGSVNKQLVSAVIAAGQPAVGISGVDGPLTTATPLNRDLQFVGQPDSTNGELLDLLADAGFVPVVACIAGDSQGVIYNVNADRMAVSCALGWRADKLFFLTDVPGVKNQQGEVMGRLTAAGIREVVAAGIAHGGMQAKLESALWGLESGLAEIVVAHGQQPDVCRMLMAGQQIGTRIVSHQEEAEK